MNPFSDLDKRCCQWLCRSYARDFVQDQPADWILQALCRLYFFRLHRYWPRFSRPRSFTEKVWHRMLFERDPRWTVLSDKVRSREFVQDHGLGEYLVPLLWQGTKPEEIPFEELPDQFVIKANHGCGYNIIVRDNKLIDQAQIRHQLTQWLAENYCEDQFAGLEWGYRNISRSLLAETYIDQDGGVPADFKFHCFSGRTECVQVDYGRFTTGHTKTFLNREFQRLPFEWGKEPSDPNLPCPETYPKMLQLAEHLARDFDFIRIDFFCVGAKIYLGELTCYPAGGVNRVRPKQYDFWLGAKWRQQAGPIAAR